MGSQVSDESDPTSLLPDACVDERWAFSTIPPPAFYRPSHAAQMSYSRGIMTSGRGRLQSLPPAFPRQQWFRSSAEERPDLISSQLLYLPIPPCSWAYPPPSLPRVASCLVWQPPPFSRQSKRPAVPTPPRRPPLPRTLVTLRPLVLTSRSGQSPTQSSPLSATAQSLPLTARPAETPRQP